MSKLKAIVRTSVDSRIRDAIHVWRTRRDTILLSTLLRTKLGVWQPLLSDSEHLESAMCWLCRAQDSTPDDGISAFYDVRDASWAPSYPETTGYIIPTLFKYARLTGDDSYRSRAIRAANWLLTIQNADGSFPIGPLWPDWPREAIVFDTGQILHGLITAFDETSNQNYLQAARRAGDWLTSIQDDDGSWRKFTSQGYVHTYNVRVAWALVRLSDASDNATYRQAAEHNLTWALSQQNQDGWFQNAAFTPGDAPLTHTIAYTIRGLLESGILLKQDSYIEAATHAANALREKQKVNGMLHARYGRGWQVADQSSCLTGNVQMAIVWLRLYQLQGSAENLQAAGAAIDYTKKTQIQRARDQNLIGGIAGTHPLYGPYEAYRYLNWAAKFFADSLILRKQIEMQANVPAIPEVRQQSADLQLARS